MTKTCAFFALPLMVLLASISNTAYSQASLDNDGAEQRVKSQPCHQGDTVDSYLAQKSRHSQRDLGWRIFQTENGDWDVERAFMVSKSMEIRYRWHVTERGEIWPVNNRAEQLCS